MDKIKLNITQLNTLIKRIIDAEEFLQTISVYGEVSNFKISAGNAYFDIKEDGASLACIKFGASNLDIKNGDLVLLSGRLNYYVKTGKLSYIASTIEPYGMGDLYKRYIALKQELQDQGLFDERYKKSLPRFANNVGVITSETGAVIRDIVHVATKKNPHTNILVYPARVQGEGAENEIISGLEYFENSNVDVVIIARGGGSFEDMAPFNTKSLAQKIFECKKPIISAVGHETDFSISDFVADMRAPTPSVAGELAFFDYNATVTSILENIEYIKNRADCFVTDKEQQVGLISNQIVQNIANKVEQKQLLIDSLDKQIQSKVESIIQNKKADIEKVISKVESLNPLKLLSSGYSIATKDGNKISNISSLNVGDMVNIKLNNGNFDAQVKKVNKEN